jgi:hypothetical protein
MVAGGNLKDLGVGGRETRQLRLPGTPIDDSPVHISRERGGAPQSTPAAAPHLPPVKDCLRRPPPLPPGHQDVGSSPPSSPFIPSLPRRLEPQIELDLDASCRLPAAAHHVYGIPIPFSLLVFSARVLVCLYSMLVN